MDALFLEYQLKVKGISREVLAEVQNWSSSTCSRKVSGTSDWTVPELNGLRALGFSMEEVEKIFFK